MSGKRALKSSVVVMIIIILGKVVALVRDSLISAKFGATYITDIYTFALGLVSLLITISYGLTTTFIPVHTEHMQKSDKSVRDKFVNNVINISAVFTLVITIILLIFAKYIIFIFGHGFVNDPKVFELALQVTRILLFSLIFVSLQSVVTGVLQCHKEFYEPAAMALVSNVVYVIYLVFLTSKFGIKGFAVATVLGFFMQFFINVPKYKKLGYKYKPFINLKDKEVLNMFRLMLPVVISTSVVQLNAFVNRAFATNIFWGAPTILDNANKINTLAYEVFAIGIAMIVYPTLSELATRGDKTEYKKALGTSINTILLIMVPAAIAIAVLRDPLITIIFKRGKFTEDAAMLTSNALLFFCPAMIAYSVRDILNKAFYSIKDTRTPMINSFAGIGINIIINIFIIKYMQVSGLTLATTISAVITTLLMAWDLNKKLNGIELKKMWKSFVKILVASSMMGIAIFLVNQVCSVYIGTQLKGSIVSIISCFFVGIAVYLVFMVIFKVDEFKYLIKSLKRK